jgi:hypothetical protein
MRRRGWTEAEIELLVALNPMHDRDASGNPRYLGHVRGERVRVVVAMDNPDFVITVHRRRN